MRSVSSRAETAAERLTCLGGLLAGGPCRRPGPGPGRHCLPGCAGSWPRLPRLTWALARGQVAQAQELGGVGGHADHVVIDAADLAVEVLGHGGQLGAQQAVHEGLGPLARLGGRAAISPASSRNFRPAWTCSIRWRVLSPTCRAAEAAADLLLDVAGQGGDADGDAGDAAWWSAMAAALAVRASGTAGSRFGAAPGQVLLMRQGAAQGLVQARQVAVEGVQLARRPARCSRRSPGRRSRTPGPAAAMPPEVILMLIAKTRR